MCAGFLLHLKKCSLLLICQSLSYNALTQLVLTAGEQAVVLSRQQLQLSPALSQISLLKAAQSLDVVEICPEIDADWTGGVLFDSMDGGLPLLNRGPITECHVTLTGFVGQEVDHLRRALTGLQQHSLPAVTFQRNEKT